MPLMALWSSNPGTIGEFTIEQVVATAGDGNLRDESAEARYLFSNYLTTDRPEVSCQFAGHRPRRKKQARAPVDTSSGVRAGILRRPSGPWRQSCG
jgi:hypothetical protein